MSSNPDFRLRNASIVFVSAQPMGTQFMNAAGLARNGITPPEWVTVNEINLAGALTQVQYKNGVSIQAEGNRCVFQQHTDGNFSDQYGAHEAAIRYAEGSRMVAYQAVGINWSLYFNTNRPGEWLANKFMARSALPSGFQPASIIITRPHTRGAAACNLTFNLEPNAVVLDCNYHVELGESSAVDKIKMWQHYQANLREDVLPAILG